MRLPALPTSVSAAHGYAWDMSALVHRTCPVCDSDAPIEMVRRPDELTVYRCTSCGMLYLADIPCINDLARLYANYDEIKHLRRGDGRRSRWQRFVDANRSSYLKILEETGGVDGYDICEIGCSDGSFLQLVLDQGGRPFGVELDKSSSARVEARGIPVTEALPAGRTFDVICAFHVLEHLPTPGDFLTTVSNCLSMDGRLLLAIPNGGQADLIGHWWVGFRLDMEHLNYFSAASLSQILGKHDMLIEQIWVHDQPNVSRTVRPEAQPFMHRLRSYSMRKVKRIFFRDNMSRDGTYNLTVLARKS